MPLFYGDPEDVPNHYFIKQQVSTGRVEVCIGGTYGTICDDGWGNEEASVICKQMGFSSYGKICSSRTTIGIIVPRAEYKDSNFIGDLFSC